MIFQAVRSLPRSLHVTVALQRLSNLDCRRVTTVVSYPMNAIHSHVFQTERTVSGGIRPLVEH